MVLPGCVTDLAWLGTGLAYTAYQLQPGLQLLGAGLARTIFYALLNVCA